MTDRKVARARRRRLKAHTLNYSNRHNPGFNLENKLARIAAGFSGRPRPVPTKTRPDRHLTTPVDPAAERPSLAEQLAAAVEAGKIPAPEEPA